MKEFPICVQVKISYPGKLTANTEPKVEINPLSPSPLACQFRFHVNFFNAGPIGLQVAKGLGLFSTPVDIILLIFAIRSYLAVMSKLECDAVHDRYSYTPLRQDQLTGDVNAENAMVLCSLVYDVFGHVTGEAQADLLASVIGKPPPGLIVRELPDPAHPDVIAAGPICDEGHDKWRIVLRKLGDRYVIHTQFFPETGHNPYFEYGSYIGDYLDAVKRFAKRVVEKAEQQYEFDKHKEQKS